MSIRRGGAVFAALAISGVAGFAFAQGAPPTPAEKAIEYRQAVFKVIAGNFGPLAQSAQGKLELSPDAARKYAARLSAISEFPRDAFPDISREGKTRAKPEIWSETAEFDKLLTELNTKAQALAAVTARAQPGSDEFKSAVGAVGNACKNCHDRYREK